MKTSDRGIVAIAAHEGIVPGPYLDSVGVWTSGIGHTAAAGGDDPEKLKRGMPADLDIAVRQAVRTFAEDLPKYEARVLKHVKVPVAQHEFDSLVSWDYNTGGVYYRNDVGAWQNSQVIVKLNAGDRAGAAAAMLTWKKPASIIPRRQAEERLFRTGVNPSGRLTVWQVSALGKVIWTPAKTLGSADLLAMLEQDPVQTWLASAPAPVEAIKAWLAIAPEGAQL